jgi:hypothetical protein
MAPRIVNYLQWRTHLLERLHQQVTSSADDTLAALYDELRDYPSPARSRARWPSSVATDGAGVFLPLQLAAGDEVLTFFSTTTVFGTPVDVTLAELALECFFPGDAPTAERLRRAPPL